MDIVGPEPPALHCPRPEILDHDVDALREPQRDSLCPGLAQVERHRALVTCEDRPPQRVIVVPQSPPVAHRVALRRRLDFHDLGTEVAEQGSDVGAGQQLAELEHPDALQGTIAQRFARSHLLLHLSLRSCRRSRLVRIPQYTASRGSGENPTEPPFAGHRSAPDARRLREGRVPAQLRPCAPVDRIVDELAPTRIEATPLDSELSNVSTIRWAASTARHSARRRPARSRVPGRGAERRGPGSRMHANAGCRSVTDHARR